MAEEPKGGSAANLSDPFGVWAYAGTWPRKYALPPRGGCGYSTHTTGDSSRTNDYKSYSICTSLLHTKTMVKQMRQEQDSNVYAELVKPNRAETRKLRKAAAKALKAPEGTEKSTALRREDRPQEPASPALSPRRDHTASPATSPRRSRTARQAAQDVEDYLGLERYAPYNTGGATRQRADRDGERTQRLRERRDALQAAAAQATAAADAAEKEEARAAAAASAAAQADAAAAAAKDVAAKEKDARRERLLAAAQAKKAAKKLAAATAAPSATTPAAAAIPASAATPAAAAVPARTGGSVGGSDSAGGSKVVRGNTVLADIDVAGPQLEVVRVATPDLTEITIRANPRYTSTATAEAWERNTAAAIRSWLTDATGEGGFRDLRKTWSGDEVVAAVVSVPTATAEKALESSGAEGMVVSSKKRDTRKAVWVPEGTEDGAPKEALEKARTAAAKWGGRVISNKWGLGVIVPPRVGRGGGTGRRQRRGGPARTPPVRGGPPGRAQCRRGGTQPWRSYRLGEIEAGHVEGMDAAEAAVDPICGRGCGPAAHRVPRGTPPSPGQRTPEVQQHEEGCCPGGGPDGDGGGRSRAACPDGGR